MEFLELFRARGARQSTALASDVAIRCLDAVRERVAVRGAAMTHTEYKGYARACAMHEIAGVVDAALLRARGLHPDARAQIMGLAADGVAERLVGERIQGPAARRAA